MTSIPGAENSKLSRSPNPERHIGDIALARRITSGDRKSWNWFLSAIRPVIAKVAIDWCHRMAPSDRCDICVPDIEAKCARFSGAEAMIENRIQQQAMNAYKGQTTLAEFIEGLVNSDWWFLDYSGGQPQRLPQPGYEPVADGHRADLVHVWAVLADSRSAWDAFLDAFNHHIERTAITWCHRGFQGRVCQKCKPSAYDADHGCDAFSDAYLYILGRLRSTALAAYEGRASLSSFVYLCLHDYRWWASLVQEETGKIKLPKVLEDDTKVVQKVYYRMCWGWDSERIATDLHLPVKTVEETRGIIEEKLRSAGRTLPFRRIETVSLSALFPGDDDGESRVAEPSSADISPEVRSEAIKYWSKLPVQDRTLLRLIVESKKSAEEVARVLGLSAPQVYRAIYRIRREMPEWFKI
jgi:DNA-binding CsgD family transcriptional regulator